MENMSYKFGYPREIVTNQGSQFTSHLIENIFRNHNIKHRTSTSYHPQENGQVEVTRGALESILIKFVSNNIKYWADRLVEANLAYNTTSKTTTGFTPYELVYGKKDILLVDFEFNTLRMAAELNINLKNAKKESFLQLNGLDDFIMQALLHTEVVQ